MFPFNLLLFRNDCISVSYLLCLSTEWRTCELYANCLRHLIWDTHNKREKKIENEIRSQCYVLNVGMKIGLRFRSANSWRQTMSPAFALCSIFSAYLLPFALLRSFPRESSTPDYHFYRFDEHYEKKIRNFAELKLIFASKCFRPRCIIEQQQQREYWSRTDAKVVAEVSCHHHTLWIVTTVNCSRKFHQAVIL